MQPKNDLQLKCEFDTTGYVKIPAFLSTDEVHELYTHLERFIREIVPTLPPDQVFYDDKGRPETLKQIQAMHRHDPFFQRTFLGSKSERLAETLLGEPVVGKNMQYFNKSPGFSQPTPPHQDGYYFMLEPCQALTMWLALDDVDEENGCVRYVPRSHLRGMRSHTRTDVLGFSQGIPDYGRPEDEEIAFPAKPGDLLAHHALTIHRADGNRSANRTRRSLGFIYYGQSSRENAAAKAEYQERLTRELAAAGKI